MESCTHTRLSEQLWDGLGPVKQDQCNKELKGKKTNRRNTSHKSDGGLVGLVIPCE